MLKKNIQKNKTINIFYQEKDIENDEQSPDKKFGKLDTKKFDEDELVNLSDENLIEDAEIFNRDSI